MAILARLDGGFALAQSGFIPLSFERAEWLWLALLVPVIVIFSFRSLAGLGPARRVLAIVVRSIVVLIVAVVLAEVQRVRRNEDVTVMFLMDRSLSVREHGDAQEAYMADACANMPPKDRVGVIDFARLAYLEQLPMTGGYFLDQGRLPKMPNPERTDVAAAIRLAMAMFPHDTAKRIVLMSDGNDNMGDALTEARRAKADGVVIDVVPLWYRVRNEVYFEKMIAPASAEVGEVVSLRMNIQANAATSATMVVYHNDRQVELPPEVSRQRFHTGNNALVLRLPVTSDGLQRFEARFVTDDPNKDLIVDNNRASAFTFVSGKGKVAVMTMNPEHDALFVEALRSENIKTTVIDVSINIPDLAGLLDYSSIVLSNVPAHMFTEEQMKGLASYVEDIGGGLVMTGGEDSFGAGGWIGTPVAEILPVELELKHKKIIPRGALVTIMHSCELPRGNMWGKMIAKKAVDTISSKDYIGMLAYAAGGESWEVPLQIASNKGAIKKSIDRMQIGDMPDFDATMRMAVTALRQTDAAQKHVIIISDGDANPPLQSLLDEYKEAKITCSTIAVGFGQHAKGAVLQDVAKQTGGRYYPVRNPRTLPQIFVKESKVVRRPLLIDTPFLPQVAYAQSELLAGMEYGVEIPPLGGLVLTTPRPGLAFTPLVRAVDEGERDPVLAHWQRGLGRVVAFTSGYWPVWGSEWTQWSRFAKFWAQTIRWTMRQEAPANFDTYTTVEGNRGRIVVEALDKDADYLNFLNVRSKVIHPTKGALPVEFIQTGPGHYEGTFDIDHTGQYIANLAIYDEGDQYQGSIHTGVSVPFSPELRELATNEALLRQVADTTGGRWLQMDADDDKVFDHNLPPTVSDQQVWSWTIAWLLLPLFLLDVAARRLASWLALSIVVELLIIVVLLFGADVIHTTWWGVLGVVLLGEMIGWSIRFRYIGPLFDWLTHSVIALGTTGQRSTAVLEQLKTARDRAKSEPQAQSRSHAGEHDETAPVDAKAKFDAGEPTKQAPPINIEQTLGGAESASPGAVRSKPKPTSGADETAEDMTARLLKAKRRAKRKLDDEGAGGND